MNKADIIICISVFALAVAGVILWAVDAHYNGERVNYESTAVVDERIGS